MPPKSSGSGASKKTYVASQQHFAYAQAQAQDKDRTKVVVRRCPPELPEALFWQSVEAWVTEDTADWKTYKAGRSKKQGTNKESISSTAHIHFKKQEFVTAFAAAYQGHTFRDSKGNHFQVVVEYAPYQRVPPKKPRPDPQSGTIDDDPEFKAFVQKLTEPDNDKGTDVADQQSSSNTTGKGVKKISPLIEDLRRKKEEALLKKKLAKEKKGKETTSVVAKSNINNGPTVKAASGTVQATAVTTTPAPSAQASRAARKAASRANAADSVKEVRNGDTLTPTVDKSAAGGDSVKKGKKQGKKQEKGGQALVADFAKVPIKLPTSATSVSAAVPAEAASATTAQKKPVGKAAKVASKPKPAPAPQITILAPPKAAKETQQITHQASASPPPAASVPPETSTTAPVTKSAAAAAPGPAVQPSTVTVNKPKPIMAGFEDIFEQFAKGTQSKPTVSGQDKTGSAVTPKAVAKTVSRGKSDKEKTGGASETPTSPSSKTVTAPTADMAALSVQDKADGSSQIGSSRGRGRGHHHHHPSRGRGGMAARGRGAAKNASSPAPAPS